MKTTKRIFTLFLCILLIPISIPSLGKGGVYAAESARAGLTYMPSADVEFFDFTMEFENACEEVQTLAKRFITDPSFGQQEFTRAISNVAGLRIYDIPYLYLLIVNDHRRSAGLPLVQMDLDLLEGAMIRAREIHDRFEHTRPNGTLFYTVSNKAMGENIAMTHISDAHRVIDMWMNSPGHRGNILNPNWRSIGIGGVMNLNNGRTGWVQLFGTATPRVGAPLFRMYSPTTNRHLYTLNFYEYLTLAGKGWRAEDVAWHTPINNANVVFRLYHPGVNAHHFTKDVNEFNHLITVGWRDEGIAFLSALPGTPNSVGMTRLFTPYGLRHLYTADANEVNVLVASSSWRNEGVSLFAIR